MYQYASKSQLWKPENLFLLSQRGGTWGLWASSDKYQLGMVY